MRVFQDRAAPNHLGLTRYKHYVLAEDPQLSPDGHWIVYTHVSFDARECWQTELRLFKIQTKETRVVATGYGARWSPDGSSILYLASPAGGASQLWLYRLKTHEPQQLTALQSDAMLPAWSPDGQYIAFCTTVPEPLDWSIALPEAAPGVIRSAEPFITEALHYKQEPIGLLEPGFDQLFEFELASGRLRQLTTDRCHVLARESGRTNIISSGLSWSADGQRIFFDGNRREDADLRCLESYIYALERKTGVITQLTRPPDGRTGAWHSPKTSPDGRYLACIGYTWQHRHHALSQHVWTVDLARGSLTNLTPQLDSVPKNLHWCADSQGLYVMVPRDGYEHLYQLTLSGEQQQVHSHTNRCFEVTAVARDDTLVGVLSASHHPGDCATLTPVTRQLQQLTRVNDTLLDGVRLGQLERLDYTSDDGTPIRGWLCYPPDFQLGRCYPLIVRPDAAGPWFNYELHHYAANGYLVLTCHYRLNQASIGFGEAYTNDGFNGFPNTRIYQDILAGVDEVVDRGLADPERLFVVGSSQGGTVAAGLIGHTRRFRAAAVLRPGWIEAISGTLTPDETLWSSQLYAQPFWEDPTPFLNHSPLLQVHKVRTPTLLMTGEADWRTPMNQTEQFYAALKLVGQVPVRLIRMPGVSHGWGDDVATFARLQLYVLEWFDRWDSREVS